MMELHQAGGRWGTAALPDSCFCVVTHNGCVLCLRRCAAMGQWPPGEHARVTGHGVWDASNWGQVSGLAHLVVFARYLCAW